MAATTTRLVRWATSIAFGFERHGAHEVRKNLGRGGSTITQLRSQDPHHREHDDHHHEHDHDHHDHHHDGHHHHNHKHSSSPSHPPTAPHAEATRNSQQPLTPEQLASRAKRLSGLQLQVLSLYRGFLKVAKQKAKSEEERQQAVQYIRDRFRERASWPKRDVDTIEAWVRRGKKQLALLQLPGTESISFWIRDIPQQQQPIPPSPQQVLKAPPSAPRPKSSCGSSNSSNPSSSPSSSSSSFPSSTPTTSPSSSQ